MADELLNDGDEDIFVYMGGEQEVPRDVKQVHIAENVDTVPEGAFMNCEQLIEVEGHNKLKKVEVEAFYGCLRLQRITKMGGVKEIEHRAFYGCEALSDLELDKLESIGKNAFCDCRYLRSINMPSVRRLGRWAFEDCERLTDAK